MTLDPGSTGAPATGYRTAWLDLDGAHNVRDLGGLRAGTRRVRPGVLLRGDQPGALTPASITRLRDEIGLRAVVDLRAEHEKPQPDGTGAERLHLPLVDMTNVAEAFTGGTEAERTRTAYLRMIDGAGPALVRLLRFVVAPRVPVLVHCAAGKDRTGIAVAVLLRAAGVDEADVLADYAVTGLRIQRVRAALAADPAFRAAYPMAQAPRPDAEVALLPVEPLRSVLAVLDREGGAAGFLRAHGSTEDELTTWRELLLTD